MSHPYPTRAQTEKLFVTADPARDPEGIVSRYLEFEFHRLRLDLSFVLGGGLTERLKILHWYLADYGPYRELRLPLSAEQIAFLNSPMPLLGLGVEVTIAAYGFIRNDLGPDRNLVDPARLREDLYWWCIRRSAQFAPGGELVTHDHVRLLTFMGPEEAGKRFPLNYFARRTAELDDTLSFLNLDLTTHRVVLVCILILRAVERPHLVRFLPRAAVSQLLRTVEGAEATSLDRILALALGLSGTKDGGASEAASFRSAIEARLDRAGYALSGSRSATSSGRGNAGLCFVEDPTISSGLDPGIAVIGPTLKASGLGQATRLSIDVLTEAGLEPAVYDFGLDNPAPTGFSTGVRAPRLRTPRQINLIQLNAESIPLAFAYINRSVYDRSYNIGYFFWELTEIPKCQYLGLDMLDEIWVSSEYNREIYERVATIPVRNVGMAVEPLPDGEPLARASFGLAADECVFLTTFDSFSFIERKNPLAVLAAFQRAFPAGAGDRVRLILKTQNRTRVNDLHQVRIWQDIDEVVRRDPRITIVDETLGYRHLLGLKTMCDCYVSLHRSEGWGFGLIEAMQLEKPVIATAYSGNMDFCRPDNCYLVEFDLITPIPSEYIYVERGSLWADPSVASAAAHMRDVYLRPEQAKARGRVAADFVQRNFSLASIAARYGSRITEINTILSSTALAD